MPSPVRLLTCVGQADLETGVSAQAGCQEGECGGGVPSNEQPMHVMAQVRFTRMCCSLTLRLGSVPRPAARRVNAVDMCPALGRPGKSAVMRHTLSGCSSERSFPSASLIGFLKATAVSSAGAGFIAGPVMQQVAFRL